MKWIILFLSPVCFTAFTSCNSPGAEEQQLDSLRAFLVKGTRDISIFPIYADPPAGDYEDLRKGIFSIQDSARLAQIVAHKVALEPFIVSRIDSATGFVYLAAYLEYASALPVLKKHLLEENRYYFYGWEGCDPNALYKGPVGEYNTQLEDRQYPYALSVIAAIEYISKKPLHEAIQLTAGETEKLEAEAKSCIPDSCSSDDFSNSCTAYWVLCKLRGTPVKQY